MQSVASVEAERAMSVGVAGSGGFAVPFALDPSIVASGNGVANPIRSIARVETISVNEWRGVASGFPERSLARRTRCQRQLL